MIFLAISAGLVGLIHSLAPGHWLPVVLMSKGRRWPIQKAIFGALVAASGHIFLSIVLSVLGIWAGAQIFTGYQEEQIERYAGLVLLVFGLVYGSIAWFRHSGCRGHTHHGPSEPKPKSSRGALLFLFSIGFSPCIAALPIFVAVAPSGVFNLVLSMISFAIGVVLALVGATILVSLGLMKLDHPIFEHYGDVMTGFGIAVIGGLLFLY